MIALIIAFRNFKDKEYLLPKKTLEEAGFRVVTASIREGQAEGSEGVKVDVDVTLESLKVEDYHGIFFIGGPGALADLDNQVSYELLKKAVEAKKIVGSICISSVILAKAGILKNKKATVFTSLSDKDGVEVLKKEGAEYIEEPVVEDDLLITASGPQAAEAFGQKIVEKIHSLHKFTYILDSLRV